MMGRCGKKAAMDLGIRELRAGLSGHLSAVRAGRTITVTDHGRPIAQIIPLGTPTRLESLRAEGRVSRASIQKVPAPQPTARGTVSDLIDDNRR